MPSSPSIRKRPANSLSIVVILLYRLVILPNHGKSFEGDPLSSEELTGQFTFPYGNHLLTGHICSGLGFKSSNSSQFL